MDIFLRTDTKFCRLTLLVFALGLFWTMPLFAASDPERSFTDPATGMMFVFVKGGCYQMGDTFGDGNSDELPVHEVCVDDFYMGQYEVTQSQWQKIMGNNPAIFKGDDHPIDMVSWNDAQEYVRKLGTKAGKHYRLPTEAEWEYAARSGGTKERYAGSNNAEAVAQFEDHFNTHTCPVGQKQPNGIDLYDMSGNVWEWCQDWYGENYYSQSSRNNPQGPETGIHRINRGGGCSSDLKHLRSTFRFKREPNALDGRTGFRLVLQAD